MDKMIFTAICLTFGLVANTAMADLKLCIKLPVSFTDNGYGESNYTSDSDKSAIGILVGVYDVDSSSFIWSGYTGDGMGTGDPGLGCTDTISTTKYTGYRLYVYSDISVNGSLLEARDYNQGIYQVWTIDNVNPGAGGTYYYTVPGVASALTNTLAATSYALYRHGGGISGNYTAYAGAPGCSWSFSGNYLHLSATCAQKKFQVAALLGFAMLDTKLGVSSQPFSTSYNAAL